MSLCNICDIPKKIWTHFCLFLPIFSCQAQGPGPRSPKKREFYNFPEHGTATTRCGLGTVQTSWDRRAIKIMAVDSCA